MRNIFRFNLVAVVAAVFLLTGCGGSGATTSSGTVAQLPDTGVRAAAATYTTGVPITVTISVVPDNTSVAYAIEDTPPAGWTVSNINESGVYDPVAGKVKWGIFFDQCPLFFTYTVTPPPEESGVKAFAGTLSVDGNDSTLTGQVLIPHS